MAESDNPKGYKSTEERLIDAARAQEDREKHTPLELLRRFVQAYDTLQETNVAKTYFDQSQSYTVGHWLGTRMAGLVDMARGMLGPDPRIATLELAVTELLLCPALNMDDLEDADTTAIRIGQEALSQPHLSVTPQTKANTQ